MMAAYGWTEPPSQLNGEPTLETMWDDFSAWATTYQRPNGRCAKKFWAKFRKIFKKVLKIALKVVGVVAAIVTKGASLLPKLGGILGKFASKSLVGAAFKVAKGMANVLTNVGKALKYVKDATWFKTLKSVKDTIDLAMKVTEIFKDLFKKGKTSQP
jgi:hypothetical protein